MILGLESRQTSRQTLKLTARFAAEVALLGALMLFNLLGEF